MSAVNIHQDDNSIEIYTDGLSYDPHGNIVSITSKVIQLPVISAAMVVHGDARLIKPLSMLVPSEFFCFDTLASELGEIASGIIEEAKGRKILSSVLTLAGWSPSRERLEVWRQPIGKVPNEPEGPAYLMPRDRDMLSPCSPEFLAKLQQAGLLVDGELLSDDESRQAFIRIQRSMKFTYQETDGRLVRMVGGFAQRTVIKRDGVASGIIERWPEDQVGYKVGEGPTQPLNNAVNTALAEAYADWRKAA